MRILLIPIVFAFLLLIFAAFGLTGSLDLGSGSQEGGVYKSVDGGKTFELKSKVIDEKKFDLNTGVIQLEQGQESEVLLAAIPKEGVFRTTNGADSWRRIFTGEVVITAVTLNRGNPNQVYVGVVYQKRSRIYRVNLESRDWEEVYVETGQGTTFVSLKVNPDNLNQVYGLLSNGVLITSYNQGNDWALAKDLNVPVQDMYIDVTTPGLLYILTAGSLYKSVDGGYVFEELPVKLTSRSLASATITAFAVNPANSKEIYIGGVGQLIRSTDGGLTWNPLTILTPDGAVPIQAITVDPSNSNTLYYTAGAVFYASKNRGQSWSTFDLPGRISSVNSILVNQQNSDILYIGVN